MQIQINNASDRPVYQQVIDQIKRDIALGRLVTDDKLPTVRQLAVQLVINPNTIAKAYRQLERDGVIVTRPGSGAFVAKLAGQLSVSVCKRLIVEQIERLIVDAVHMRVSRDSLIEWFEESLGRFGFGRDHDKGVCDE